MIKTAAWPTLHPDLLVLNSPQAIADMVPLLQALAKRCQQPEVMHWLPSFLEQESTQQQVPYLVLMLRPEEHQGRSLTVDDVEAAAMFFEQRVFGFRAGALTTNDASGFSSIIAPFGRRRSMAAAAARALVERGAGLVLATCDSDDAPEPKRVLAGLPGVRSALRQRETERLSAASAPGFSPVSERQGVADLLVRRRGAKATLLCWAIRFFAVSGRLQGSGLLANALEDPRLQWTSSEPVRVMRLPLGKAAASGRIG